MRKFLKTLIIISMIIIFIPLYVKAEAPTDINDLVENAKEMDGQEITIQGEAIGERMDRGDYSWININDGTNAIGIWLKKSEADQVLNYGNNKYHGDTLKITGTFYRACEQHGGEADFHGSSIKLVKTGYKVQEQVPSIKIIVSVILIMITSALFILFLKKSKTKV